ncbi:hypothetical protein N7492_009120 [Penicillium capsulatum]|uniref:Methyltransferase domain-containing protein n=1 Tax=Penicillium capsulatum TaxID=69766 RepID=A0A9W9HSD8_9EURO|nr:hypothetical protein N7492_009120 [Penicillium capsulatum]KAJ6106519.1 hypothetical protein N7512_010036 [Penicillium capsulatum]
MTDFTETNRQYFDQLATAYKDRFADAIKTVTEQTLSHRTWISDRWTDTEAGRGQGIRMLEYACGPGMISMALAPFLTNVVGVDVSENMVDEFNRNAAVMGLSDKVTGHKADLLAESVSTDFSGPTFSNFDLLTVSMALHHFEHPDRALQQLTKRLKSNGVCFIIDLVPEEGHHGHSHHHGHGEHEHPFGEAAKTVKTHGFSREDMQRLFEGVGLNVQFEYEIVSEPFVFHKDEQSFHKTVFMARAQLG